jgi:hypothetical protein
VREHFKLNRDAPLQIKIDAESGYAWQRSHQTYERISGRVLNGTEYKTAYSLRPKIGGFLRQGRSAAADGFYIRNRYFIGN